MTQTILMLRSVGQPIFIREYPWEHQAWRECYEEGVANHETDMVAAFLLHWTLYTQLGLDARQLALSLIFIETIGSSRFESLTIQGVGGRPEGPGYALQGTVISTSKKFVGALSASIKMENTYTDPEFQWKLTIDKDIFAKEKPKLSQEVLKSMERAKAFAPPPRFANPYS